MLQGRYLSILSISLSSSLCFLPSLLVSSHILHSNAFSTMIRSKGDGHGGRGVTFVPKSGEYKNVLYWFHGLGDTADGWADLVSTFPLQKTKIVLPTAPTRPISLNGGYPMPGWSDIYGLDMNSKEDLDGFNASADRVHTMIQSEIDKGIHPSHIIVGGFSQGGALAFHIGLRSKHTLGGTVALSTWLPFRDSYPQEISDANKNLPILQLHGDSDTVVPHPWGHSSNALLKSLITQPEPKFRTIEGLGHGWDSDELEPISSFLSGAFDMA